MLTKALEAARFPHVADALRAGTLSRLIVANSVHLELPVCQPPCIQGNIDPIECDAGRLFIRGKKIEDIVLKLRSEYELRQVSLEFLLPSLAAKVRARNYPQLARRMSELRLDLVSDEERERVRPGTMSSRAVVVLGLTSLGVNKVRVGNMTGLAVEQVTAALHQAGLALVGEGEDPDNSIHATHNAFVAGVLGPDKDMPLAGFLKRGMTQLLSMEGELIVPGVV